MDIFRLTQAIRRYVPIADAMGTGIRQQNAVTVLQKQASESGDSLTIVAYAVKQNDRSVIGILRLHEPGAKR